MQVSMIMKLLLKLKENCGKINGLLKSTIIIQLELKTCQPRQNGALLM